MENIFDTEVFNNIKSRIESLEVNTQAQWGKMSVDQMVHHCQGPLNIILEKETYGLKPSWFARTFFKKSMYSDKLWRKNLPTLKEFRETRNYDFQDEKQKLISLLEELGTDRERTEWQDHPTFGPMTKEQWGKMHYKHLDHHLRQFGV
ncbi:MAG: DUF1569 domain-containing protein [Bacteroidia bacterium]|nr:DUF1569 domain-containing protein [Bacteroidia bacterium]MBT8269564.1 DUF1569 domain-containing protein [Bacteroidia bacterium]NNF83150.1 DUF1569 domain-containing protein [Flavobacteriaceae bacterium]NNK71143.1 DUF1569 domain-containing protein [Flavobacteriaceae bacterium]NNL79412.1 DUF1569 domain-containing protein [Flavobacteriaceae bacterium]